GKPIYVEILLSPGKSACSRLREELDVRLRPGRAVVRRVGSRAALACCPLLVEGHPLHRRLGARVRDPDRVTTEPAAALASLAAGPAVAPAARGFEPGRRHPSSARCSAEPAILPRATIAPGAPVAGADCHGREGHAPLEADKPDARAACVARLTPGAAAPARS